MLQRFAPSHAWRKLLQQETPLNLASKLDSVFQNNVLHSWWREDFQTCLPALVWWPSESSSCNKQRSLLLKSIISKRFSILLLRVEWSHCDPFWEERTAGGSPCPGYELFGKQSSILSFLRFFVSCKNQGMKFWAGSPSSLHRGVEKNLI